MKIWERWKDIKDWNLIVWHCIVHIWAEIIKSSPSWMEFLECTWNCMLTGERPYFESLETWKFLNFYFVHSVWKSWIQESSFFLKDFSRSICWKYIIIIIINDISLQQFFIINRKYIVGFVASSYLLHVKCLCQFCATLLQVVVWEDLGVYNCLLNCIKCNKLSCYSYCAFSYSPYFNQQNALTKIQWNVIQHTSF